MKMADVGRESVEPAHERGQDFRFKIGRRYESDRVVDQVGTVLVLYAHLRIVMLLPVDDGLCDQDHQSFCKFRLHCPVEQEIGLPSHECGGGERAEMQDRLLLAGQFVELLAGLQVFLADRIVRRVGAAECFDLTDVVYDRALYERLVVLGLKDLTSHVFRSDYVAESENGRFDRQVQSFCNDLVGFAAGFDLERDAAIQFAYRDTGQIRHSVLFGLIGKPDH